MRTLTSIASADHIVSHLTLHVQAADASTTWVWSDADIMRMDGLRWEVDFGGGLGRTADYRVTISDCLDTIKARLPQLTRAEVTLDVLVNSDRFYPHVGWVRGIERDVEDPNQVTLHVFDRIQDDDPLLPVERLATSWSSMHPEDLALGYGLYYGHHHREFFFTAVTCDLGTLLGPRNVSSHNHVSSLYFDLSVQGLQFQGRSPTVQYRPIARGDLPPVQGPIVGRSPYSDTSTVVGETSLLLNTSWDQQSGSTNQAFLSAAFEVMDIGAGTAKLAIFEGAYGAGGAGSLKTLIPSGTSAPGGTLTPGGIDFFFRGYAQGPSFSWTNFDAFAASFRSRLPQRIRALTHVTGRIDKGVTSGTAFKGYLAWSNNNGGVTHELLFSTGTFQAGGFDLDLRTLPATAALTDGRQNWIVMNVNGAPSVLTVTVSMHARAQLFSEAYRRHSVFAPPVNSGEVAISANPFGILDDVWSHHLGIPYRQDQSSDAQAAVNSHVWNCYFDEQQAVFGTGGIADVFAKQTGTYLWIGDSGMLNFRSYTESGAATVNAIIQPVDRFGLKLHENPLGTTAFNARQASRFSLDYGYDFRQGRYTATREIGPATNALCQSADAAGIRGTVAWRSPYILSSDVASLVVGHMARIHGQGQSWVDMSLPGRYLGLEMGDVLEVHDPSLVGSRSLFQVTVVEPDFRRPGVRVRAAELLQADGS